MDKIVELLAFLTLTIFGLVLPVLSIIISLYNDAFKKLSEQYEIEKNQTQENINGQLSKIKVNDKNIGDIQRGLDELEQLNKTARKKLNLLKPGRQFLNLSISNALSFAFFASYFLMKEVFPQSMIMNHLPLCFVPAFLGLVTLSYLFRYFTKIFKIVVEASGIQNQNRIAYENSVKELLTRISEKGGESSFLTKVFVSLDNQKLRDDSLSFEMKADAKQEFRVKFTNQEKRMAKNIEVGFVIPKEFLVEKKDTYSIFNSPEGNIVRYKISELHAGTYVELKAMTITALKKGDFQIRNFIKAENVESIYRITKLHVT